MKFLPTPLSGLFLVIPEPVSDSRGWFARTYCEREFAEIGHQKTWVQLNHSYTEKAGTIRGMHFQKPPHQEIKLVRCISGAVMDVVVDLRKGSPSFLHWYAVELSPVNRQMLYIPGGFAHGFQTLSDKAELIYHHSEFYQPLMEGGIRYNDPVIGIQWPLPVADISDRDLSHALIESNFSGY